jgi:hypothetical protein
LTAEDADSADGFIRLIRVIRGQNAWDVFFGGGTLSKQRPNIWCFCERDDA